MTWQSVCRPVGDAGGDRTNDPRSNTSSHSRREFLANLAAFGLTAVTPARRLIAQTQTAKVGAKPGRIDFHHHVVPPFYLAENRDRIVAASVDAFLTENPSQCHYRGEGDSWSAGGFLP